MLKQVWLTFLASGKANATSAKRLTPRFYEPKTLVFFTESSSRSGTSSPSFSGNSTWTPKHVVLPNVDDTQIEEWLFAIENTRHTVTLPMGLALNFAHLTRGQMEVLDEPSTLEFYKLLYSRVVKFTSYIEEFSAMTTNDRKFLLSHNLEALSIVRLAVCFGDAKSGISQLKEFGRPDVPIGQKKIEIWQIFRKPWAADDRHVDLYCRAMLALAALPAFDIKSSLLLQLIALFDTAGSLKNSTFDNVEAIERQQEKFTEMLLSYLRTKMSASKSNVVLHQYLTNLATLRTLCEMIARQTT